VLPRRYSVDHDALKAYFPLETVVGNMLALYATLLSLRFDRLPTGVPGHVPEGGVPVWHEDVRAYRVIDAAEGGGAVIGHFYLDLHPREG
jgi:Zn-dependent oligopeptidase